MQELKYRPITFKAYRVAIGLCLLFILFTFLMHLDNFSEGDLIVPIIKILIACGFSVTVLWRLIFFIRPRIYSVYNLSQDKLNIAYKNKNKDLCFSQVKSVSKTLLSPRFLGGFKIVTKTGHLFIMSSLIENCEDILNKIYHYNSEVMKEKSFKKLINRLKGATCSWQRLAADLKSLLFYINHILPLALVMVYILLNDLDLNKAYKIIVIAFCLHVVLSIQLYLLKENFLNKIEYKNFLDTGELKRALKQEVVINGLFFVLISTLYILAFYYCTWIM